MAWPAHFVESERQDRQHRFLLLSVLTRAPVHMRVVWCDVGWCDVCDVCGVCGVCGVVWCGVASAVVAGGGRGEAEKPPAVGTGMFQNKHAGLATVCMYVCAR